MDAVVRTEAVVLRMFQNAKADPDWAFADAKPSETSKWTHCYHRYPAKFIPQLVEKLFDEYLGQATEASINDPFVGSGTTIVSAIARGYRASGTDINRIAALMTRVKATPIEPGYLAKKLAEFERRIAFLNPANGGRSIDTIGAEPVIPARHLERIDYWFPPEQKLELGYVLWAIDHEEDPIVRDFLLVAFSHILKNCSIWLKTSTKPTRDFKKTPERPYEAIMRHLKRMERGNQAFFKVVPERTRAEMGAFLRVSEGDAREQPVADGTVDLVVTSSPYVTSYEYADLHQLSTIWLDLADDLIQYKKEFIGTAYKRYEGKQLRSAIAQEIVDRMNETDGKMAKEIEAFFLDMENVIAESHRILKTGGRACYVIGDTRLKGVDILNAEAFGDIMVRLGFALDRVIKREIPSKILPQTRDARTGKFAKTADADNHAYPFEYIVIGKK